MKYQRVTKSAQKEQPKAPSSSLHRTSLNPVTSHPLLDLQRTIGNQAVLTLLRSRNMQPDTTTQPFVEPRFSHDFSQIPIRSTQTATPQTKLQVSQPGNVYEQEADQVAEQVMRMSDSESPMSDDEGETKNSLMRKQSTEPGANAVTGSPDVSPIVHTVLSSGGGQPLDPATRTFMESRFGQDFSHVRVHTDAQASESARQVNALAYTVGSDMVFGAGQYAPETSEGMKLMAHELTHVVQWMNRLNAPAGIAPQNHSSEVEAHQRANDMTSTPISSPGGVLQRQVAQEKPYIPPDIAAIQGFLEGVQGAIPAGAYDKLYAQLTIPANAAAFAGGEQAGILVGVGKDLWGILKGLFDLVVAAVKYSPASILAREEYSLLKLGPSGYIRQKRQQFEQARQTALDLERGLKEFLQNVASDPPFLSTASKDIGQMLGQMTGKWFSEKFMGMSPFDKGETVGEVVGYILLEIALLFVGPEELAIRASAIVGKAAEGTRLGRLVLEVLGRVPSLAKLLETSKFAKVAGKVGEEASIAEKGIEATRGATSTAEKGREAANVIEKGGEAKAAASAGTGAEALTPKPPESVWVQLRDGRIREYQPFEVEGDLAHGAEVTTVEGNGKVVSRGEPPHSSQVLHPEPPEPATVVEQLTPRERAAERGRALLKTLKEEGVGTGAGRSGGHGTPHQRAGAELIREANRLPKDDPMREALKIEGERLIQQGKSHSHR